MFGGLEALPVLLLEMCADLVLAIVAVSVVRRVDPRVGMALFGAAALTLVAEFMGPISWIGAIGIITTMGGGPAMGRSEWPVAAAALVLLMASWAPYIARSIEVGTVAWALVKLVRRLPGARAEEDA